ncbi:MULTISPECIES: hypothetical protein [Clostridium]|uniref:hypothetical protein n=1 Tax=Clostridium TaxID=1485 RepID=UPI0028FE6C1B|nr:MULTISPECIES: hypothetical protein [Clostridium]MDU2896641.1 hypothetical protein [Clostridium sp.]MDU3008770.1 hypothetical protein [Clostridium sp.]MDU3038970.1 hypothetical protein [Clostridium sp.]MDU3053068.1 hypothetical protein [Clostridium sp.]
MINSKSIKKQEAYYENLVIKYNPDNGCYKKIAVATQEDLFKQIYSIIALYLEEPITFIQEQYEEIEPFWAGEGEYYVLISPYSFGQGVAVNLEKL